ncbi:PPC domain-containing protein [Halomonas beimenensis]|uniref:Peptidase C-terminal archaeal/bacterial domain-containing protein n=1 Tax=Halomonas beimenensis TaxID=475662 RepID=A0A291PC53_9GAMM|nr:PPC domain-containing protein [Halomonas beimenensis]ATJ84445.1 hypothetical protein BEI_3458 [Halomonas beimenensis]
MKPQGTRKTARRVACGVGLAGLALLAGCTEEPRFVAAPEVTAGNDIQGELTSASPLNLNDGTRRSAHWLCAAGEEETRRYTLEAPFAASLSAFDGEGRWLGAADSRPDGAAATLLHAPAREACTLVVVSGRDDDAFGPYRLVAEPASEASALAAGRPLVGTLQDGQVDHALSLERPVHLSLALSGGEGLGMRLLGEGVSESARACAPGELRLDAYLEAGDYRVRLAPERVSAADETAGCDRTLLSTGGAYRLVADQRDLGDGQRNGGPLRDGDRIRGRLAGGTPNVYSLHLDQPSEVSLGLRSQAFDTVLRISGEGADITNDDGGNGTDSRLATVLMPGDYRVEVDSYYGGAGDYALDMGRQDFSGEFRNDGELSPGEEVRGQLTGLGENRYRFEVDETAEVRLALDSLDFDPVLRLVGEGVDVSDDDSGGERNALIQTVLEPGRYTLEVQSYSGSGVYTLHGEQSAFEGRMSDGGEIVPGEVIYGRLPAGGSLTYRLELEAPRSVVLETTASGVDTVLRLAGQGVDVQNDDASDLGLGSRITQRLEPGTYTVEVSGFGGGAGLVRLAVRG